MARRFSGRRRFTRVVPRNRPAWLSDTALIAAPTGGLDWRNIFDSEIDAEVNETLEAQPTVHRIIWRGYLRVAADSAGYAGVSIGVVVAPFGVDPVFNGVMDPGNTQSLSEDDWLYFDRATVMRNTVLLSDLDVEIWHRVDADIRVKRRLKSRERLVVVVSNEPGSAADFVVLDSYARTLVKLNA